MSLDGKIATSRGDSKLSSPEDLRRVHRLRASVDAIMVGLGTVLADDPKLTVKLARGANPVRVIVDSKARTPLKAYVVKTVAQTETIIAVTSRASIRRVLALQKARLTILTCGNGPRVLLPLLLRRLWDRGVRRILLEGGGTLNWSMLSERLVDEVSVAISPRILGGADAVTLVDGIGVGRVEDALRLRLVGTKVYGSDRVLRYRVLA